MAKNFLITGTSTGFGYEYAQECLDQGAYVVATARKPEALSFKGTNDKNYLAVKLDVTDKSSITAAFQEALKKFGRIDVVVNNAGYGLSGMFEEYTEEQIRQQMEINFFGVIDVTRTALETLREQKPSGGLIQQVTSIGGQKGTPGFSIYCASKWAVEGFTEAVSQEVNPEWGIKFTCVEPGGFRYLKFHILFCRLLKANLPCFRTDWGGRSMTFAERIPAYSHLDSQAKMKAYNGNQKGDPKKGAKAMYKLATMPDPPLRVVLGSDAYATLMAKLDAYSENYRKFKDISESTDVDGPCSKGL
jgi:NAD(P)-dependent dehydrogenase (short-subunit alcohol dehydrogenase family)